MWQNATSPHPETTIATITLELLYTSLDLSSRMNESYVLQAVGNYATSDGIIKPSDFELRVVDANTTFYLPSVLTPWSPPPRLPGDCSNIIVFNAYFVGDNSTSMKHVHSLFDDPHAGKERLEVDK